MSILIIGYYLTFHNNLVSFKHSNTPEFLVFTSRVKDSTPVRNLKKL